MGFHLITLVGLCLLTTPALADTDQEKAHAASSKARVAERIVKRVNRRNPLPPSFSEDFRNELERFLEGKEGTDSPSPVQTAGNVEELDGENYAEVLQEFVSEGRRTRILRIQRAGGDQGSTVPLPGVAKSENPAPTAPSTSPQAPESGLSGITVIRAASSGSVFSKWAKPQSPKARKERLEAEMKFRQIQDQVAAPTGTTLAGETTNTPDGIAIDTRPTDQIIVVEDIVEVPPEPKERRLLATRASWDGEPESLTWGTVTQSVTRMADRYQPKVRQGVLGLVAAAASLFLLFFFLFRKKQPTVAMRAYRSPVHRRGMPTKPAPVATTTRRINHPFGMLSDGEDARAWQGDSDNLKALDERDPQESTNEDREEITVTGEIEGAKFRSGVQVSFDPKLCRWVIKKFSPMGNAAEVLAVLQPGTVVRGAILRTSNGAQRYRLTPTGTWIPTCEEENLILAVSPQNFR